MRRTRKTSHSIYGEIFITFLIKANVFLLRVQIKMRKWVFLFMACLVLPGWDVAWLICGTDKSSVTLSLCWVMSCSTTAVDFWVMDKVFIGKKLWKTLPWDALIQICSPRRATCEAGMLLCGLTVALLQLLPVSVYSHSTRNFIISSVCFSHQFSEEQPITI